MSVYKRAALRRVQRLLRCLDRFRRYTFLLTRAIRSRPLMLCRSRHRPEARQPPRDAVSSAAQSRRSGGVDASVQKAAARHPAVVPPPRTADDAPFKYAACASSQQPIARFRLILPSRRPRFQASMPPLKTAKSARRQALGFSASAVSARVDMFAAAARQREFEWQPPCRRVVQKRKMPNFREICISRDIEMRRCLFRAASAAPAADDDAHASSNKRAYAATYDMRQPRSAEARVARNAMRAQFYAPPAGVLCAARAPEDAASSLMPFPSPYSSACPPAHHPDGKRSPDAPRAPAHAPRLFAMIIRCPLPAVFDIRGAACRRQ